MRSDIEGQHTIRVPLYIYCHCSSIQYIWVSIHCAIVTLWLHCLSWRLHPRCQAFQEGSYTHWIWALSVNPNPWERVVSIPKHCPVLVWVNPRPTPQVLVLSLGTPLKNCSSPDRATHSSFQWSCSAQGSPSLLAAPCFTSCTNWHPGAALT